MLATLPSAVRQGPAPLEGASIISFAVDRWTDVPRCRHHVMSRLARRNRVLFTSSPWHVRETLRRGLDDDDGRVRVWHQPARSPRNDRRGGRGAGDRDGGSRGEAEPGDAPVRGRFRAVCCTRPNRCGIRRGGRMRWALMPAAPLTIVVVCGVFYAGAYGVALLAARALDRDDWVMLRGLFDRGRQPAPVLQS
jgi:hypothetical protein